jgi:hypothetical protein
VDRSWEYINRSQIHEYGNFGNEAAQFPEKEYINGIFVVVSARLIVNKFIRHLKSLYFFLHLSVAE